MKLFCILAVPPSGGSTNLVPGLKFTELCTPPSLKSNLQCEMLNKRIRHIYGAHLRLTNQNFWAGVQPVTSLNNVLVILADTRF